MKGDKELILLLDGERLPLGQLEWNGDTSGDGRTWEGLELSLPTAAFESILNAGSIEGKLGHRTFQLQSEHLLALKRLYVFPPEPPAPRPLPKKPNIAKKK